MLSNMHAWRFSRLLRQFPVSGDSLMQKHHMVSRVKDFDAPLEHRFLGDFVSPFLTPSHPKSHAVAVMQTLLGALRVCARAGCACFDRHGGLGRADTLPFGHAIPESSGHRRGRK